MNAHGKEDGSVSEMRITATKTATKPDYKKTAVELLERCRAFYRDEENERAFQEWQAQRKKKGA